MDIKVTGNRLKNLLSYEWVKIIVSIVAGVVVWSLLFTTLATRATVGEQFVFVIYENVSTLGSNSKNNEYLSELKKNNVLSYDVLDLSVSNIASAGQYTAGYMLSLRVTTQEGDVMLISDGRAVKMEEGSDEDPTAEIQSAINNRYFYDFQVFLDEARRYCVSNGFITENASDYTVNEDVIREYFLNVRLKSAKNYRKTFRTEAQKREGVRLEIARIKAIYDNYLYVTQAIAKAKAENADFLWYGNLQFFDDNGKVIENRTEVHPFGIDLAKLNAPFTEDKPKVENRWYTYANGKTTAEGLVMCVFNFNSHQYDLQFESLAFIRNVIETYSGY